MIAPYSDTSGPLSCDRGPAFELEAELSEDNQSGFEVIYDDSSLSIRLSAMVQLQVPFSSDNGPFETVPCDDGSAPFFLTGWHTSVKPEWKCGTTGGR